MESTRTKNLRHLYDLAHAVPETPSLGSMYAGKLFKTFKRENLTLPNQITNGFKFCSHCETVLIPGLNMTMRIVYTKTKKNKEEKQWRARERKLKYKCLSCNHATFFDLLKPECDPSSEQHKEEFLNKVKEPFVASWNPNGEKKTSSAKDRAKRRKKNNLANLLNGKKEREEQEKKKSSLLSLDEFMKG